MTPFPHLDAEQQAAAAALAEYDVGQPPALKARSAREACRLLTHVSQVREEVVAPFCVGRAPHRELDARVVEDDLIRVLIGEIMVTGPGNLLHDAVVGALKTAVRRRWASEAAPGGLWSWLAGDPDLRRIDLAIGERLGELDARSRAGDWAPLAPSGLESLRDSVPPGAVRWRDD